MQNYYWQDRVFNDNSSKIKILKGRRVGATELTFKLITKSKQSIYISYSHKDMGYVTNRLIKKFSDLPYIKILEVTDNGYSKTIDFGLVKNIGLLPILERKCVEITSLARIQSHSFQLQKKQYDKLIADEVIESDVPGFIKDRVKQQYYFFSPSITDSKWYVIPSCDRYVNNAGDSWFAKLKKTLGFENYHQEIMAGVTLPKEAVKDDALFIKEGCGVDEKPEPKFEVEY